MTLFGCCKGPDAGNAICVFAYFPCCSCLNGNAAVVSGLGGYQLCCLGTCFAPCCTHAMMRMKVVEKYKLLEPSYKTIPIACCCCPCSTVQLTSQIMQEHEKQFSDIIASAALVDRPAGLEGAKKLRPSMLGDLEREVSRWNKIDQLEAPLANVMDREQRVDVAEASFSLVAKMAAEIVYEGWMEHELDKHSSYMQQVMLSDLLAEMVENVSEEVCAGWSSSTNTAHHSASKAASFRSLSRPLSFSLPSLSLLLCVHTGVARPLYHKSNDEIVASMAEEALMPVMVEVAAECRLEGVAALVAVAKEDIDKKQKKADRLNKMKKESGDKEKFASKKFEATKKEVTDESTRRPCKHTE